VNLSHPSGCDCPAPTVVDGGRVVLDVHTCPRCLRWERKRRYGQVELFPPEGVVVFSEGDEPYDTVRIDPSEVLAEIRSVDPSF